MPAGAAARCGHAVIRRCGGYRRVRRRPGPGAGWPRGPQRRRPGAGPGARRARRRRSPIPGCLAAAGRPVRPGRQRLQVEPARCHHDRLRPRRRDLFPGGLHRAIARRAATRRPPAAVTRSGTQCPAVKGGSTHSMTATAGGRRPATRPATAASRSRSPATSRSAWGGAPARRPTVRIVASTSSRLRGSREMTSAVQPR